MSRRARAAAVCPTTGLTIPECSCRRCLEEQMRSFSPLLRRGVLHAVPPSGARPEPPAEDDRAAA